MEDQLLVKLFGTFSTDIILNRKIKNNIPRHYTVILGKKIVAMII